MTGPNRERRWSDPRELAGGLLMFVAEAVIVLGLAAAAWVLSVVVLAFF